MRSLETRGLQIDEIFGHMNTSLKSLIQFNVPHLCIRNPPTFYLNTTSTNYAENAPVYLILKHHNEFFSSVDYVQFHDNSEIWKADLNPTTWDNRK